MMRRSRQERSGCLRFLYILVGIFAVFVIMANIYHRWVMDQTQDIMNTLEEAIGNESIVFEGPLADLDKLHLNVVRGNNINRTFSIEQGPTWLWGDQGQITLRVTFEETRDGQGSYPCFTWYIDLKKVNGEWVMVSVKIMQ